MKAVKLLFLSLLIFFLFLSPSFSEETTGLKQEAVENVKNLKITADSFFKLKNFKKAAKIYIGALDKAKLSGDKKLAGELCLKVSESFYMVEDKIKALDYANQSINFM